MKEKTILLVEDDFLNRRLSKKALLDNGYFVLEAKNAREAREILKRKTVTLVILDIHLGELEEDGITLGQHIKEEYAVPFIYLTAYDNAEVIAKAVSTSPYSYLTKPFKNSDLIASIEIAVWQSDKKYIPKISVRDMDYNVELPLNKINYIESEGNYLLFHTDDKVYKLRSTVRQIMETLPEASFVQVHRAYIVNKAKVEKSNLKSLMVKNTEIPISKNYVQNII